MNQPLVSVIIPVYNAGKFLTQAIRSILDQTFRDFELIAVDDGSTDGSLAILREFEKLDSRMRIISRPNTGIVGALNDGLAAAKGELIARMDADDYSPPDRFQKQVDFLQAHRECVSVSGAVVWADTAMAPIETLRNPLGHDEIDQMHIGGQTAACVHGCMMARREALVGIGGYRKEYEWAEDYDLFLLLAEYGRLANLPDVLLTVRSHVTSVTVTKHEVQLERTRAALADAYRRRGLGAPPAVPAGPYRPSSSAGTTASWALRALRQRRYGGAIRLAVKAVRKFPAHPQPWAALALTLAGPLGRPLIGVANGAARKILRRD